MNDCYKCTELKTKLNKIMDPYERIWICLKAAEYGYNESRDKCWLDIAIPSYWKNRLGTEQEPCDIWDGYISSPPTCEHVEEQIKWIEFQYERAVLEVLYATREK